VKILARYLALLLLLVSPVLSAQTHLVISQIFGGGGNSGAIYNADYVELYNPTVSAISLAGYSVQYASVAGTTWQVAVLPNVSVAPSGYFLIKMSATSGTSAAVPFDFETSPTISMALGGGKLILSSATAMLSGGCPSGGSIVDLVGYGTANCFEGAVGPAPSNTLAITRSTPPVDTDNNAADFSTIVPAPHHSGTGTGVSLSAIGSATPSNTTVGTPTLLLATVTPATGSTGITVKADLSSIGGPTAQSFYDDATNGDVTAGDNVFSFLFTPTTPSVTALPVTISDTQGHTATTTITLTFPATPYAINQIQGQKSTTALRTSPHVGELVQTSGIVTGVGSAGFFIQSKTPDADPLTPEGIYIFTGSSVPAQAVAGNEVQVIGKVSTYPALTVSSFPATEINTTTATILSTANPLPAPITLTTAMLTPGGGLYQLTPYEGMRVSIPSMTAISGTDGTITEASATTSSNGQFYAVITGTPRPFREPGVDIRDKLSVDVPAGVQKFDDNPERMLVDSSFLLSTRKIDLATGAVLANVTGILDFTYSNDSFYDPTRLLLDPGYALGNITAAPAPQPVPAPASSEFTVAAYNIERFFNTSSADNVGAVFSPTTNATQNSSAVNLSAAAYARRLTKVSLAIRTILNLPDVVALEETENQSVVQDIANQIQSDMGSATPVYTALGTGTSYAPYTNDIGGISVGFLVKNATVNQLAINQYGQNMTFPDPRDGSSTTLNDRPPLVLHAGIKRQGGAAKDYKVTVIVNHLRSLSGESDNVGSGSTPPSGPYVRKKKELQAEFLASLIQGYQTAGEQVVSVGDYNDFEFNDGYIDIMATVTGQPGTTFPITNPSVPGLVNPPATNLALLLPANQRWSYVETGSAQILDHIVATSGLVSAGAHMVYAHLDADYPVTSYSDATTPARTSDHDAAVGYFALPAPVLSGSITPSAPISFGNVAVGATSSQSIVFTNTGEGPLAFTSPVATGDFAATNTCGTSVAINTTCSIAVTFRPTSATARTGTLTVTTSSGTSTVSLAGGGLDFSVTDSAGKNPTAASVTAGTPATVGLTFTSLNSFSGTIALSCTAVNSVFAPGLSCNVPASFALTAGGTSSQTVTLTANPRTLATSVSGMPVGTWLGCMMSGLALLVAGRLRKARFASVLGILLMGAVATLAATGCSDTSNLNPVGTPAGTYTYAVTATSGTLSHAETITITVQ
jgi:uncharacterized protein